MSALAFIVCWFAVSFFAGPIVGCWIAKGWKMLERDWLEAKRTGQ